MSKAATPFTPFVLRGTVIHGHGRGGSQLGYPTANVELSPAVVEKLLPYNNLVLYGYGCIETCSASQSLASHGPFPFVMSVGFNPHFKDTAVSAEVHFLEKFSSDFYAAVVRIVALGALREQSAFTTLEALIDTIDGDVRNARAAMLKEEVNKFEKLPFVQPNSQLSEEENSLPYFAPLQ